MYACIHAVRAHIQTLHARMHASQHVMRNTNSPTSTNYKRFIMKASQHKPPQR